MNDLYALVDDHIAQYGQATIALSDDISLFDVE
jgi:hypothetical protein